MSYFFLQYICMFVSTFLNPYLFKVLLFEQTFQIFQLLKLFLKHVFHFLFSLSFYFLIIFCFYFIFQMYNSHCHLSFTDRVKVFDFHFSESFLHYTNCIKQTPEKYAFSEIPTEQRNSPGSTWWWVSELDECLVSASFPAIDKNGASYWLLVKCSRSKLHPSDGGKKQ